MTLSITTPRLRLSGPDRDLAPAVVAFFVENRAHLAATSPPQPDDFFTLEGASRRLAQAEEDLAVERRLPFFVLSGDEVIGTVNFNQCFRGPFQACYLGYAIGKRFEGRGLMREALEAALDHVFTDRGFHRVMANYLPTNERSGGLLRRLGFVVEGYARDYLFIDGAWRDHVLTAKTNPSPRTPWV